MKHIGTKEIETNRLLLRQFTEEDAESIYSNWASDGEVTKYLIWPSHKSVEESREILAEWIENYSQKDYYQWAITLKENPSNPIGSIGVINEIDEKLKKAHIGYCIGKEWWHRGITSEALKGVLGYLFNEVGINRAESRYDPRNSNSGAVMKKCGMKYEGTLRQNDWNNQGVCDVAYYGLLKEDWVK